MGFETDDAVRPDDGAVWRARGKRQPIARPHRDDSMSADRERDATGDDEEDCAVGMLMQTVERTRTVGPSGGRQPLARQLLSERRLGRGARPRHGASIVRQERCRGKPETHPPGLTPSRVEMTVGRVVFG